METEYGKWLRESLDKGGSVPELACELGVHRKQIHRWLHGQAMPTLVQHLGACEYFAALDDAEPPCPFAGVLALAGDGNEGATWYLRGIIEGGGTMGAARDSLRVEVSA